MAFKKKTPVTEQVAEEVVEEKGVKLPACKAFTIIKSNRGYHTVTLVVDADGKMDAQIGEADFFPVAREDMLREFSHHLLKVVDGDPIC